MVAAGNGCRVLKPTGGGFLLAEILQIKYGGTDGINEKTTVGRVTSGHNCKEGKRFAEIAEQEWVKTGATNRKRYGDESGKTSQER